MAKKSRSDYDVLIGYIHEFTYSNPESTAQMNGHPFTGRVYRLIKDADGFRLHIGRENNNVGLDGLFLGTKLKDEKVDYSYNIEIVTPSNYLKLPIIKEDSEMISKWIDDESNDLWAHLEKEITGETPVIKSMSDLLNLIRASETDEDPSKPIKKVTRDELQDNFEILSDEDTEYYITADRIAKSLTKIVGREPEFVQAIADVLEYLASTYSDKYEDGSMPNLSKSIVTKTPDLGKGANIFTMFKYLQRYSTEGFKKSNNIEDIYKTIHYALFEVQRRRYNNQSGK